MQNSIMELKQNYSVSVEDQIKFNELNAQLPFKTTTYITYDANNAINVVGEKVNPKEDGLVLEEPTGDVKAKFDALDERTLSGNNWDKKS